MKVDTSDLIGQTIFKLEVLDISDKTDKSGHTFYNCRCECGKITVVRRSCLIEKTTKTCGECWLKLDLTNQKFNDLYIQGLSHSKDGNKYWLCLCKCKELIFLSTNDITSGRKKSCRKCTLKRGEHRKWNGYGEISQAYWNALIRGAKQRNIIFDIDIKYGWELFLKQNRRCILGGDLLIFSKYYYQNQCNQTASLDRIESSKEYTKDNIQWIHKDLNFLKNSFNQSDFIRWCNLVAKKHPME